MAIGWLTNDPEVAKLLRAADRRYERARIKTQGMRLGEKIEAQRAAKAAREAEYEQIMNHAKTTVIERERGDVRQQRVG